MLKEYSVSDVGRYVINYSNDRGYGISNLKLQKILYLIQAYFLISVNRRCFSERIEAWDFGPVIPDVYHEYKQFGGGDIPTVVSYPDFGSSDSSFRMRLKKFDSGIISDEDKETIEAVVDKFADYSATALVSLTHNQDPWIKSYVRNMNNEITPRLIKEYFNE